MSMNTQDRREMEVEALVDSLGLTPSWWQNLHEQDATVKAPLGQAKVVAELGPWDLW